MTNKAASAELIYSTQVAPLHSTIKYPKRNWPKCLNETEDNGLDSFPLISHFLFFSLVGHGTTLECSFCVVLEAANVSVKLMELTW